jgi:hypothetical protein
MRKSTKKTSDSPRNFDSSLLEEGVRMFPHVEEVRLLPLVRTSFGSVKFRLSDKGDLRGYDELISHRTSALKLLSYNEYLLLTIIILFL